MVNRFRGPERIRGMAPLGTDQRCPKTGHRCRGRQRAPERDVGKPVVMIGEKAAELIAATHGMTLAETVG